MWDLQMKKNRYFYACRKFLIASEQEDTLPVMLFALLFSQSEGDPVPIIFP